MPNTFQFDLDLENRVVNTKFDSQTIQLILESDPLLGAPSLASYAERRCPRHRHAEHDLASEGGCGSHPLYEKWHYLRKNHFQ